MRKRLVILLAGLLTVLSMGFGLAQFSDVPAGHWAKEAVEALAAKGLITGYPDGTFRGSEALTRYQAALLIYRLLQQIEAELKAGGESPTMEALSEADLQTLRNAVQELASELNALGVRVSALEDKAATQEDIARLEAMIEELKALPIPELGMDRGALMDLLDRVEAASIAADTALAQAQQLAEQLDALSQEVEGAKSDVAALQSKVEANADAIQSLNELAVLLNQDVLTLQDRVTALEKSLAELQGGQGGQGAQGAQGANLEELATKEDVAAVQEFAAALRSDLAKLEDRVGALESKVAELSKVRYTLSGSLSATYGTVVTDGGTEFDLDRLFPKGPFTDGDVSKADSNKDNISEGKASLTFGVKVAEPGSQGVNVSEANATLDTILFKDPDTNPTPSLKGATVKGNVDGQPFSVVYSKSNSAFKFNDYLFANDPGGDNLRGVVAIFEGTKCPLSPQVTVVTGTATEDGSGFKNGSYFGIRTAFKPFERSTLALSYATNLGNRSAIGLDGGLEFGPLSLSGLWVSSQETKNISPVVGGGRLIDFFNPKKLNEFDWAYYIKLQAKPGPLSIEFNYHAVDPEYEDAPDKNAGMSKNLDVPYKANTRGFGIALSTEKLLGFVSLKGYAESEGDYALGSSSVKDAAGLAATLGSFQGFSLTLFGNWADKDGNSYFFSRSSLFSRDFAQGEDSIEGYKYTNENQKYSSSLGFTLTHDGKAQDALIQNLNLTVQYARFYVGGYHDFQLYATLANPVKLSLLNLDVGGRFHRFDQPVDDPNELQSESSGDYTTFKLGLQASTDPLFFGLSLDGAVSYRNTDFSTKKQTTRELYWRIGPTINDFLAPRLKLSGAYAQYRGDNLTGDGLLKGSDDHAFDFTHDQVYQAPNSAPKPWEATSGNQSGRVKGFYVQAEYYNLTVAYGQFDIEIESPNRQTDKGRGFKISYKVEF